MGSAESERGVTFLQEVAAWLGDPANWTGERGLITRTIDHIWISVLSVTIAVILMVPVAVVLAHYRKGGLITGSLVNLGRAIPSFGLVALAYTVSLSIGLGFGFWPTLVALVALAMPPIFTNAHTGVGQVEPAIVEAGRGTGMSERQVLLGVEVPLAMPVIWTAIRVSAVAVVATATLGAIVGWGGLGRYVIDGFAQGDDVQIFIGGVSVALLAIATDLFFTVGERWVLPRGTRAKDRTELEAAPKI
jgi:osmoprotectant transport system permease protein